MPFIIPAVFQQLEAISVAVAAVLTGLALGVYSLMGKKKKRNIRRMSFNSQVMVHGAFPPDAGVATPIINVVMMFQKCPNLEGIKKHYAGLLTYDRFRAIPVQEKGAWVFRLCDTNIDSHIHCSTVEDEKAMKDLIDVIVSEPLRTDIPYWCVHRIETKAGVSCVLTRLHHVIADGISLVTAITKVFCDENNEPLKNEMPINYSSGGKMSFFTKIIKLLKAIGTVLYVGISPYDSDIKFTAPNKKALKMTTRKTLYFPSVKLEFIKALKAKAGVTVNDILLAATTGAIRKYSSYRGDDFSHPEKVHNRALVPLAFFRPLKDLEDPARAMSNKFAFLSVDMPISQSTAVDRVNGCNATMAELKTSPVAFVQLWVQSNLLSLLPVSMQRQIAHDIFSRHTIVFSNVPGPNKPIHLAGEKVVGIQVIFPNLLPQVILISYAGSVFHAMVVDDKLILEPEKLFEFYLEDLREVAKKFGIDCSDADMLSDKTPGNEFDMISL